MVKANLGNFFIVGLMAVLFILLFKSVMGVYPVKGLDKIAFAL